MKRPVLILLVLAALATAGVVTYRNLHQDPTNRILVSGNIELNQVDIGFKTSGRLI